MDWLCCPLATLTTPCTEVSQSICITMTPKCCLHFGTQCWVVSFSTKFITREENLPLNANDFWQLQLRSLTISPELSQNVTEKVVFLKILKIWVIFEKMCVLFAENWVFSKIVLSGNIGALCVSNGTSSHKGVSVSIMRRSWYKIIKCLKSENLELMLEKVFFLNKRLFHFS